MERWASVGREHTTSTSLAISLPEILVAEAFARLLRDAGFLVVGCYVDADALADKIERARPDLVLVDPLIEAHDGRSSILERIQAAGLRTKVVVLVSKVDGAVTRALVRYGVRGVILRSAPSVDAISVLRQVADGQVVFPSSVMTHLARPDEVALLSGRQREVLDLLAHGASNSEIAGRLYISSNTVKFHLREIYGRLGVRNRVEAARLLQRGAA
jgi:two-component system nitrate/nitrite response regulator NarP